MALTSRFDWDAGNLAKCQAHGVTTIEIEHVLDNDPYLVPDYDHSQNEDRNIAVGLNPSGRPVFVVFTLRVLEGDRVGAPAERPLHASQGDREI